MRGAQAIAWLSLVSGVAAHGRLLIPEPRPPAWRDQSMQGHTNADATYRHDEPAFFLEGPTTSAGHDYTDTAYRCKDFAPTPPSVTISAGGTLDLSWTLTANHPGDCALYISYDEPTTPHPGASSWVKIADFVGCVDQALLPTFDGIDPPHENSWQITLPDWLPASSHAVLRWEWLAVQSNANIEFFVSCSDVIVSGTAEPPADTFAKLHPVVMISGIEHLPAQRSGYRNAYSCTRGVPNAFNACEFGPDHLASPALATYSGLAPPPSVASPPPSWLPPHAPPHVAPPRPGASPSPATAQPAPPSPPPATGCAACALPECGCDLRGQPWCTVAQHCYATCENWMAQCGGSQPADSPPPSPSPSPPPLASTPVPSPPRPLPMVSSPPPPVTSPLSSPPLPLSSPSSPASSPAPAASPPSPFSFLPSPPSPATPSPPVPKPAAAPSPPTPSLAPGCSVCAHSACGCDLSGQAWCRAHSHCYSTCQGWMAHCGGAASPSPPPPKQDEACVAEFGSCQAGGGSCCGGLTCVRKNRHYSQCLKRCPTDRSPEWECSLSVASARPQDAPTTEHSKPTSFASKHAASTPISTNVDTNGSAHGVNVSTGRQGEGEEENMADGKTDSEADFEENGKEEGESGTRTGGASLVKDGALIAIAVSAGIVLAILVGLAIACWRVRRSSPPSNAAVCVTVDTEGGAACSSRNDDVKTFSQYSNAATTSAVGSVILRP